MSTRLCEVDGCAKKHLARGYCGSHYGVHVLRPTSRRRTPPIHMEDVEWLAETDEVWERAVERLGVQETTLRKYLERNGRLDLLHKLRRRVAA